MDSETDTPSDTPTGAADESTEEGAGARPGAAGGDAPRGRRPGLKTVRDMLLSMLVVSLGAFALYIFVPHDTSQDSAPPPVEYEVAAATAARAAPYELLVPEGLTEHWRATSVRYEPRGEFGATWRLGFVSPEEEYAALAQAEGPAKGFIDEITQGAGDTGESERIQGREWERYEGSKYDALVNRQPGGDTLVFGTASFEELAHLAAALRPQE